MTDTDDYIRNAQRRDARLARAGNVAAGIAAIGIISGLLFWQCNGCEVEDDTALRALSGAGLQNGDPRRCRPHGV